jgi:hypothetical protein
MRRLLVFGAVFLGACATMNNTKAQEVLLLKGKMESFGEVRDLPSHGDEVVVGALVNVQLGSVESLIGELGASHANVELPMAAMPKAGELKDVYVLGRKLPDGSLQTLRWDYAIKGLCVQHGIAKTYSIEDDLMRLRRTGGVNWNPDCDW